jgi:hypothetical protein
MPAEHLGDELLMALPPLTLAQFPRGRQLVSLALQNGHLLLIHLPQCPELPRLHYPCTPCDDGRNEGKEG